MKKPPVIFTIGHSTRSIEEFVALLKARGVELVADVRSIPGSARNPHYNGDTLARSLHENTIAYEHLPGLGGLRRARKDSVNTGWTNASFRGFADYMQTKEFAESLEALIRSAQKRPTALLCAEAVPWRCHRSLIADALLVRGIRVLHIISRTGEREHTLTPLAETNGDRVTYPGPGSRAADDALQRAHGRIHKK